MEGIYEIFHAILSNTSSPEERNQFDELMKSKENKRLFTQVQKIWNGSATISHYPIFDKEKAFYELQHKIELIKRIKKRYVTISIAACVILTIGIFSFFNAFYTFKRNVPLSVQTDLGNRSFVVLPDSTKVWLNSQSKIQYLADFGKEDRSVKLSGEGFFSVKHSKKPFIVDVGDLKITVYGTRFNVTAYNEDQNIFTCLESGKISIEKKGEEELFIEPGQLVTYNKTSEKFKTSDVDASEYSAWKENKMYLHAESLDELAAKLERQYNVQIWFVPESLGRDIHYTGMFGDENIEEVLDAISVVSDLKYNKNGNKYEIVRK